jgi:hypothetical protein
MKRFIVAAILVGALTALVGGTALAAGPITPPGQGFGAAVETQATGTCPCGGVGAGGMMQGGRPGWAGLPDEVAEKLGGQDAIHALRLEGQSLVQIAAAKGLDEQDLIDAILADKQAKLAADDRLDPDQVELMIQNMTDRVKTMVNRTDVGPAFGQGGARGMMGQGMRGGRWNQ